MNAGGRRSRQWRSPECLGTGYPPPAAQRLPLPPAPYPCVVQRNGNGDTFQVRRSETYPLIRTPESRCQESMAPRRLTNNRSTDGRGRPFDMEHDDVLQVWQQSPHKDTLGFYGVGSPTQQPESLKFNQVLAQALEKVSGIPRQRPTKPHLPPQLRRVQSTKPFPSQPCPALILNRWALQLELQRMPHVQQQLSPQKAINSMYCWVNPDRKNPFGSQQKPLHNLNRQRPVAPIARRRTKFWYCPPCCVPSAKTDVRDAEAFDQPDPAEPKNYDELYSRLVGCFEPKGDPLCKVYEACCKPKKQRGKDGGAGGTGGGAGGTGGAGGGDGDGEESDYKVGRASGPGRGSVLRHSNSYISSHGEGDGGQEKDRGDRGHKRDKGDKGDTGDKTDKSDKDDKGDKGDRGKKDAKKRKEEGDSKVPNDAIKNKGDGILIEINKEKDPKKDKDGESIKSKFEYVRRDKKYKTPRDEPPKKGYKEEDTIVDAPPLDEEVEDYKPVRLPSHRASRTPSKVQMEQPPPEDEPQITKDQPTKKPHKKRGHSKEKKSDSPCREKDKKSCPPCPPPECKCEICTFMERRRKEPEAPFIREMRRAEKRRQLRNYYRQMCHRNYMACRIDEKYRAPLRKCDPIQCEDFFCGNTRLYEHCECLGAVQELQKLLKGTSNKQLLEYVDNLCQRICQRMCDCILT
ncbi:uncharacterized protein Dana_GF15203 [Drosophila ananassae]|uniref:Uncharacterized protein n=1 Tax=Drosophila ananassae TaxID=7217 RepID=B3MNM9_DROAN|nr:uncharacterized protein LOC6498016 [Drosophila ananassae]EDV31116.1 uncharacterized protein Dana_GF15203 [Drosophila ananassae]